MTEPNYKEIAEKLYNVIKTIPSLRGFPQYHLVMKEYENLTKPKMTFLGYSNVERFVYEDKDYALIDGYWYHCRKSMLCFIEDGDFADELSVAQLEYEKSKPV